MKTPIRIIQPRIKTQGCGVSDHSRVLQRELTALGHTVSIHDAHNADLAAQVPKIQGEAWLIQLSIYGYHARGIPLWLPQFLEQASQAGVRLLTYFHETWVPRASPRESAYWLLPVQKHICTQVAKLSQAAYFNSHWTLAWGRDLMGTRAHFAPTFSNVGEPTEVPRLSEREPAIVCFGAPKHREAIYRKLQPHLPALIHAGAINKLIDVGAGTAVADDIARTDQLSTERLGPAPAGEVSVALIGARYGLFSTPWSLATKSGIYAAYAAHGTLPVSIDDGDTLQIQKQHTKPLDMSFLSFSAWTAQACKSSQNQLQELERLALAAHAQYLPAKSISCEISRQSNSLSKTPNIELIQ